MYELTPVMRKFILHWGEMGTRWGINRTVAQLHALLYVADRALHAEAIAETLGLARSNVSTSLRELQGWGIVRIVHVMGDRRDHFESLKDPWQMFQIILDERKRREIDPTIALLAECVQAARTGGSIETHTAQRLGELLSFFETMTGWYQQFRRWPQGVVLKLMRLGEKLPKLLGQAG
jgi:DNA-binding transcriptional regulator GbsR (MarR family)